MGNKSQPCGARGWQKYVYVVELNQINILFLNSEKMRRLR